MSDLLPQRIIRSYRETGHLPDAAVSAFVAGLVDGGFSDAQAAALAMAICCRRRMPRRTLAALTRAMASSGRVLAWPALDGPVLDKHATGGVGDTVSLILAPALAACGAYVPMLSGRGLGHTGGTLDKLDSIPGYCSRPDAATFARVVREVGCVIGGQTADLAPADRRLYAIRDVTGTVESLPLIVSSILSKKLASGLDGIVFDVKQGSGAFRLPEGSTALAEALVAVAAACGLPARAWLTDMNQPLAPAAGNALEVREALLLLRGGGSGSRLAAVCEALAGEALLLGGLAPDAAAARRRYRAVLADGRAAERFARMVHALGGPADLLEQPDRHLPQAPVVLPVRPERRGVVAAMDGVELGWLVVGLGGGRRRVEDAVDPRVGLSGIAAIGGEVGPDRPLATIHAADQAAAERAAAALRAAIRVEDGPLPPPAPVWRLIAAPPARRRGKAASQAGHRAGRSA